MGRETLVTFGLTRSVYRDSPRPGREHGLSSCKVHGTKEKITPLGGSYRQRWRDRRTVRAQGEAQLVVGLRSDTAATGK